MVFGWRGGGGGGAKPRGPKAVLSAAIASALGEYFVVDADLVESNLLQDTKIVLRSVLLRERTATLPGGRGGADDDDDGGRRRPAVATVTGSVDQVVFSWSWSVGGGRGGGAGGEAGGGGGGGGGNGGGGGSGSWVRDATLTVSGLKFKARLEHGGPDDGDVDGASSATGTDGKDDAEAGKPSSSSTPSSLDDVRKEAQVAKEGGLRAYVRRQVEMIVDALTLRVRSFEFALEMPSSLKGHGEDERVSLVWGGDLFELLSSGREPDVSPESQSTILRQVCNIGGVFARVDATKLAEDAAAAAEETTTAHPLVEPFGYSAEVARRGGRRFGDIGRGLRVAGGPNEELGRDGGLVFHVGKAQIEAIGQLSSMMLARPGESEGNAAGENTTRSSDETEGKGGGADPTNATVEDKESKVSSFEFRLPSLSLVAFEDSRVSISSLSMTYLADGSKLDVAAERFQWNTRAAKDDEAAEEQRGVSAAVSGISLSMYPRVTIKFVSVDSLYIPEVFELLAPVENTAVEYEGTTLTVNLASVEGVIPDKGKKPKAENAEKDSKPPSDGAIVPVKGSDEPDNSDADAPSDGAAAGGSSFGVPLPVKILLKQAKIKSGEGEAASTQIDGLELYLHPDPKAARTQVALCAGRAQNHLLQLNNANVYALVPADRPNFLEEFQFMSDSLRVTAGHSAEDWIDTFRPQQRGQKRSSPVYRCPFAQIGPLRLKVAYSSGVGVKVKETSFVVKAFKGKGGTTSRDLLHFYAKACLGRVPGFVSNAEVLGLNVADSAAGTYGAWLGMATPVGAGGGVAAVTAVDAVKGAVAAGKRARNADEGDQWRAADFFRGVLYSAEEAAQEGAARRGKTDGRGNVADWAVGATAGVGDYVDENKSRLGAAGGAGAGMVVGTLLAGPIGGIVGGVLTGAVAGRKIKEIEDKQDAKKSTDKNSEALTGRKIKAVEQDKKDTKRSAESISSQLAPVDI